VRHVDAALAQEFLYVAVAQGEAIIQPDPMPDDLTRKVVIFVACGISGWRPVWLPSGVFGWFLMVHHWGEYLTGQEAGSIT
jgi:hypothetical protein